MADLTALVRLVCRVYLILISHNSQCALTHHSSSNFRQRCHHSIVPYHYFIGRATNFAKRSKLRLPTRKPFWQRLRPPPPAVYKITGR